MVEKVKIILVLNNREVDLVIFLQCFLVLIISF